MPHIASLSGFHVAAPSLPQRLTETLRTWKTRARERNEMAKFNVFDLKDIGMTDAERRMHIAKPIWRE